MKHEKKEDTMFKKVASMSILAALILAGVLSGPQAVRAAGEVKIGLSAPLTGDWAEYGNDFKRSVTLVIDKANQAGGINGRKIELVIADSRGDAKESVLIAEKFVADPTIIAQIGDFSSSSTMAAAPVCEQAKMVQISPTASHQDWTKN
jgi:branched-chain amino acid transport system substrate-binding protein